MTRKHTNNQMQEKPNDFGLKYGNQKHNVKAKRINNMTEELEGLEEVPKAEIHINWLKTTLKNIRLENAMPWWNAWFVVHEILLHSRQTSTRNEQMPTKITLPEWMTKGKATLVQKDPSKGTAPNNHWPITCLTIMWKLLRVQIREEIYYSLTSRGLFPEEQKGCQKGSRGTVELLYIDQHILNESKTRWKNLATAWIDNKMVYDIVPQSWIISCLKMYKISHEVISFTEKTMKNLESGIDSRRKKLSWSKNPKRYFF